MIPKAIVHRQKSARNLKAALRSHRTEAAKGMARELAPETTPALPLPDLEGFQLLLRQRLERARRELLAADEAHQNKKLGLLPLRAGRDAAVKDLRSVVHRLRMIAEAAFGPGTSRRILTLDGPTPRDPVVLAGVVRGVLGQLRTGTPPGLESLPGTDLHPEAWIPLLEEPLHRLEEALHEIAQQKRVVTQARVFKNRAQAAYDELEGTTRRMLREMYRYAGLREMAETLKPRRRRSRSREVEEADTLHEEAAVAATPSSGEIDAEAEAPAATESRPRLALVDPFPEIGGNAAMRGLPPPAEAHRRG